MNFIKIFWVLMLLVACSAEQKVVQHKADTDIVLKNATQALDELVMIADGLESKNPRFAQLNQKAKSSKLTNSEQKEVKNILDKEISQYYSSSINKDKIKKDVYRIIAFNDSRCKECPIAAEMLKEISHDLNVNLIFLKPEEFAEYSKQHGLSNDLAAMTWLKIYSDPTLLNKALKNSALPIILHSKKSGMTVVTRVIDIESKQNLQSHISVMLNTWDNLEK